MCDYTFFSKDQANGMSPTNPYGDVTTSALSWSSSTLPRWLNQGSLPSLTYWHGVTPKEFAAIWHFYWYCPKRVLQERESVWACYGAGPPLWGQGFHHRWCSKETCLACLFQAWLALCIHVVQQGHPSHASSKGGSLECHDGGDAKQHPMQKDLPIRGPSTFAFRDLSSVPQVTEWVFGSGNNISAQITIPRCDYAWWWAYFLASGPLTVHDGRM